MRRLFYLTGFSCALGLSAPAVAAEPGALSEAIRAGLPKYNPTARDRPPEPPRQNNRPAAQTKAAPPPAQPNPEEKIVTLPELVVRPEDDGAATTPSPPARRLPRLVLTRPPGKDTPTEKFETPAARDERLVKKHLSEFDRSFLNRFTLPVFGESQKSRARKAEAIEQSALQLNELSEALERRTKDKKETAEDRKLRELYYDLYLNRPR